MNVVLLVGNLGKDPEMRYTPAGKAVVSATLATNRRYTNAAGEKVNESDWHNLELWGNSAEAFATHAKKGAKISVEGRIKYEQWEADGVKHYKTKIVVTNWEFAGGAKNGNGQTEHEQAEEQADF